MKIKAPALVLDWRAPVHLIHGLVLRSVQIGLNLIVKSLWYPSSSGVFFANNVIAFACTKVK